MKKTFSLIWINLLLVLVTAHGLPAGQSPQKTGDTSSPSNSPEGSQGATASTAPTMEKSSKTIETPPAPKVFKPESKFNSFDDTYTISIDPQPMQSFWAPVDFKEHLPEELHYMSIGAKWNSASNLKDTVTLVVQVYSNKKYYNLKDAKLNIDKSIIETVPSKTVTNLTTTQDSTYSNTWYVSKKEFSVPLGVLRRIVASERTQIRITTLSGDIDDTVNRYKSDGDAVNALTALLQAIQAKNTN